MEKWAWVTPRITIGLTQFVNNNRMVVELFYRVAAFCFIECCFVLD